MSVDLSAWKNAKRNVRKIAQANVTRQLVINHVARKNAAKVKNVTPQNVTNQNVKKILLALTRVKKELVNLALAVAENNNNFKLQSPIRSN